MKLTDVAALSDPLPYAALVSDDELAREIQNRLIAIGLLDPPADGKFGPVSAWALAAFAKRESLQFDQEVSSALAQALLAAEPLELNPGADLAGRIVSAMQAQGYWVARDPACLNIAYVEGMNPDGKANANKPNQFNDIRVLIQVSAAGVPELTGCWEGTTEPGRYWTEHPMNSKGAARIAFGQYKAWVVGKHHPGKAGEHEALVQVEDVIVFRDKNQDYKRDGDLTDKGLFWINQHWGYDEPANEIRRSSAGCLVGRSKDGHREFMKRLKKDPRYTANNAYRFMAAVMPASAI